MDADLAAPDVVIEAPEELPPFIDRLVVVQPADQGDIVRKRVAQRGARVILIPGILEAAGVETKADVVIKRVITTEIGDPWRVHFARVEGSEAVAHAAGIGLAHRVEATALKRQSFHAAVDHGDTSETLR